MIAGLLPAHLAPEHEERAISVPDLLALSRILLVPVVMALTVGEGNESRQLVAACLLFTVAAVTDFFDGYLARKWNVTSTLGAFLDTTADKLLVTGSLLALVAIDRVSIWAALIIVMREFVVMALRGLVALGGGTVRPSQWGKIKATAQFVAIGFAFIRFGDPFGGLYLDQWMMLVAVVLTVVSAWQYLAGFWEAVRGARSGAPT
jgi:CDP-diacylglycerol--glycerol-3-phosphate 3-phosphatidyltransferase